MKKMIQKICVSGMLMLIGGCYAAENVSGASDTENILGTSDNGAVVGEKSPVAAFSYVFDPSAPVEYRPPSYHVITPVEQQIERVCTNLGIERQPVISEEVAVPSENPMPVYDQEHAIAAVTGIAIQLHEEVSSLRSVPQDTMVLHNPDMREVSGFGRIGRSEEIEDCCSDLGLQKKKDTGTGKDIPTQESFYKAVEEKKGAQEDGAHVGDGLLRGSEEANVLRQTVLSLEGQVVYSPSHVLKSSTALVSDSLSLVTFEDGKKLPKLSWADLPKNDGECAFGYGVRSAGRLWEDERPSSSRSSTEVNDVPSAVGLEDDILEIMHEEAEKLLREGYVRVADDQSVEKMKEISEEDLLRLAALQVGPAAAIALETEPKKRSLAQAARKSLKKLVPARFLSKKQLDESASRTQDQGQGLLISQRDVKVFVDYAKTTWVLAFLSHNRRAAAGDASLDPEIVEMANTPACDLLDLVEKRLEQNATWTLTSKAAKELRAL